MAKIKSDSNTSTQINIGTSESDRRKITRRRSSLLADPYTLYLTTHNFRGKVTGPMFHTLDSMFMAQYSEPWTAVDSLPKGIRCLGQPAPERCAKFAKLSTLLDAAATPPKALEMVRIPIEGQDAVARTACSVFPLAEEARDEPTADLLTQRLTVHEQTASILRSLREEQKPAGLSPRGFGWLGWGLQLYNLDGPPLLSMHRRFHHQGIGLADGPCNKTHDTNGTLV